MTKSYGRSHNVEPGIRCWCGETHTGRLDPGQHPLVWVVRRSLNFRAGCGCGWQQTAATILERDAVAAHQRHTGTVPPAPPRTVPPQGSLF